MDRVIRTSHDSADDPQEDAGPTKSIAAAPA